MTSEEFATEMELYGTSPGVIAVLMIITTLVAPCGIVPSEMGPFGRYWYLYSLVWLYSSGSPFPPGFWFLNYNLLITLPLCMLQVVFAIWIVRYYQSKTTKYTAMTIGLLSILLPTILVLYFSSLVVVIYPIPIQFIIGLIILWRIDGPEVISPWSGMRLDLSWWKWPNRKRGDDWDALEREKEMFHRERSMENE